MLPKFRVFPIQNVVMATLRSNNNLSSMILKQQEVLSYNSDFCIFKLPNNSAMELMIVLNSSTFIKVTEVTSVLEKFTLSSS